MVVVCFQVGHRQSIPPLPGANGAAPPPRPLQALRGLLSVQRGETLQFTATMTTQSLRRQMIPISHRPHVSHLLLLLLWLRDLCSVTLSFMVFCY